MRVFSQHVQIQPRVQKKKKSSRFENKTFKKRLTDLTRRGSDGAVNLNCWAEVDTDHLSLVSPPSPGCMLGTDAVHSDKGMFHRA